MRAEMTKEENKLWYEFLKDLPVTINRQKVFGNYIADFYCAQYKVAIELDGSQRTMRNARRILRRKGFEWCGIAILKSKRIFAAFAKIF